MLNGWQQRSDFLFLHSQSRLSTLELNLGRKKKKNMKYVIVCESFQGSITPASLAIK